MIKGNFLKNNGVSIGFVTLSDLLDALKKGRIKRNPKNRGQNGIDMQKVNSIVENFDVDMLGQMEVDTDGFFVDWHHRCEAILRVSDRIKGDPNILKNKVVVKIVPAEKALKSYAGHGAAKPHKTDDKITHPDYLLGYIKTQLETATKIKLKNSNWISVLEAAYAYELFKGNFNLKCLRAARRQLNFDINKLYSGSKLPFSKNTLTDMISALIKIDNIYKHIDLQAPKTTSGKKIKGFLRGIFNSTGLLQMLLIDILSTASPASFTKLSPHILADNILTESDKIVVLGKLIAKKGNKKETTDAVKTVVKLLGGKSEYKGNKWVV